MEYIIGIIAALLGALWYQSSKRKSAEAVMENLETAKKNLELDKDIVKNEGLVEAEKVKRDQILKDAEEKKNETSTVKDLIDFFLNRK